MAESKTYYKAVNAGYDIDTKSKTIIINEDCLKKSAHFNYIVKGSGLHSMNMDCVYFHTRERLKKFVDNGYKVIFEYKGKRVLIVYNK